MTENASRVGEDKDEMFKEVIPSSKDSRKRSTGSPAKKQFPVRIPPDLLNRIKNGVFHTIGLSLTEFVEEAVLTKISTMEKKYGGAFPQRKKELSPGRPISV